MRILKFQKLFSLFIGFCLLAGVNQLVYADEYQIDIHYCFGNTKKILIDGRVVEPRFEQRDVLPTDSALKNIWNRFTQFFNEEEEGESIYVNLPYGLFKTTTDDEGYFSFNLLLNKPLQSDYHSVQLWLADQKIQTECQLYIVPEAIQFGIISDFDDTVIVSNVTDKASLLMNTFTKNYTQREVVKGMPEFYREQLSHTPQPELAPLFFVTGSPRQLQKSIEQFLDFHHFPRRVVITKKLHGSNSDPLFDQFSYKVAKIESLFDFFPKIKFLLVGDDGEKDPEVYQHLKQKFPNNVAGILIRQVSPDINREKLPGQVYFFDKPLI